MPRLAYRQPEPLFADHKYPMDHIASGLPMTCEAPFDYECRHLSFLSSMRRFARENDVVFRFEQTPRSGSRPQQGWIVQFFWDLYRSRGDAVPKKFDHVDDDPHEVMERHGPYVREMYAKIPPDLRFPVPLD